MIPGQYHCAEGLWLFDVIGALDQWVEHGNVAVYFTICG
jgi:hypothetical protein